HRTLLRVEVRKRVRGLGQPRDDTRRRESGTPFGAKDSTEVDAVDPVHDDDVVVVFEEVVAYERKVRVERQREEDARLVEHELAVGVRTDRSELERDEPAV